MSHIKRTLTRAEMAAHLARAQKLRAAGVDLKIPDQRPKACCPLDIRVARGPASLVCDLAGGMVGYAMLVRLVATRSHVILPECRITTEWDDEIVLLGLNKRILRYRLGSLDYAPAEVLNQRIEDSLRFYYRGQMMEGMILANSLTPIPDAYSTGAIVPVELTFTDSLNHEIAMTAELFVDRTLGRSQKRTGSGLQPSSGLYSGEKNESPDVGGGDSEDSRRLSLRESGRGPLYQTGGAKEVPSGRKS